MSCMPSLAPLETQKRRRSRKGDDDDDDDGGRQGTPIQPITAGSSQWYRISQDIAQSTQGRHSLLLINYLLRALRHFVCFFPGVENYPHLYMMVFRIGNRITWSKLTLALQLRALIFLVMDARYPFYQPQQQQ